MTEKQQKIEISKMIKIEPKYLMGTKAYHKLGDISSDKYDLFSASGETDKFWIGMWTTGFGFINVLFPKETSRELTNDEVEKYNKMFIQVGSQPPIKLNIL